MPAPPKPSRKKARVTAPPALAGRGVRLTRQRKILLDLIDKTGQHLDAERLFQLAKEKDPKAEPRDRLPHIEAPQGRRPG